MHTSLIELPNKVNQKVTLVSCSFPFELDYCPYNLIVVLGGVTVIVLAVGQRFAGSNPAMDDGFLTAIKIRSQTSFGGK
jgi:hypothetical protein